MKVNEMIHLFRETVKTVLYNFIPHEMITCDNRGSIMDY